MKFILAFLSSLSVRIKNKIHPKSELDLLIENGLKVGKNFNFFNSHIDYGHAWLIEIGDDVTITNSSILAHDASTKLYFGKSKIGKVTIGNRVFIGFGSIILCNVTIGDDVIVAAGSVVTKSIPSGSVVAGCPATVIGSTTDFINKHQANLQAKPVYDTYWPQKTHYQKEKIRSELSVSHGYDE
ncbi:acyltransferase [Paenibacillus spiritus]|uniref:Acyltransferase n=1 Tax=Paenibacillus spiritus TaxID=2496557 RepID=A0A5J5GHZ8_9BACL|nr:acyltransferase [Paenibacillus spiritus]KAA9007318.1 acyltransferase [Paenibacillus spiritus]